MNVIQESRDVVRWNVGLVHSLRDAADVANPIFKRDVENSRW